VLAGAYWVAPWFMPAGFSEKMKAQITGNIELPACDSRIIRNELINNYGKLASRFASALPADLIFKLERAKELRFDEVIQQRICVAQYSSIIGKGEINYTVFWWDTKRPSLDAVDVKISDATLPELVKSIKQKMK
jgi:hypothetical protein